MGHHCEHRQLRPQSALPKDKEVEAEEDEEEIAAIVDVEGSAPIYEETGITALRSGKYVPHSGNVCVGSVYERSRRKHRSAKAEERQRICRQWERKRESRRRTNDDTATNETRKVCSDEQNGDGHQKEEKAKGVKERQTTERVSDEFEQKEKEQKEKD